MVSSMRSKVLYFATSSAGTWPALCVMIVRWSSWNEASRSSSLAPSFSSFCNRFISHTNSGCDLVRRYMNLLYALLSDASAERDISVEWVVPLSLPLRMLAGGSVGPALHAVGCGAGRSRFVCWPLLPDVR